MCTPYVSATPIPVHRLLSRRGFLRAGAATGAAVAATSLVRPGLATAQVPVGTAGCVPVDEISLQLYTMRELAASDLDGMLAAVAGLGYRIVEHAGFTGTPNGTAAELKASLDAAGLHATSGHQGVPFPFDQAAWEQVVSDAKTLGQRRIVEPAPAFVLGPLVLDAVGSAIAGSFGVPNPVAAGAPAATYREFAATLNQAAEIAAQEGIGVGYHNHNPEFLATPDAPGKRGYDILMEETDPDLVHFELDLYWSWAAEVDPLTLFEQYPTRFQQFHVKDMAEDGSITDPGTGIIDFDRIFVAAHDLGIAEYTIEQDNAGANAIETARLGYELLSGTCAAGAPSPVEVAAPPAAEPTAAPTLPTTGGGLALIGAAGVAGALALRNRRA